ncbi:MAG: hypothetical protein PHS54_02375 [Clostridia bacterium]|nr:hypothetical protein [Clostridia bacterium]
MTNLLLSEIDSDRWVKRKEDDLLNFKFDVSSVSSHFSTCGSSDFIDKRGVVGEELFHLSFSLKGALSAQRILKFSDAKMYKSQLISYCPELEYFITLNLWVPENDLERHEKFREIENALSKNDYNSLIELSGNYRLGGKDILDSQNFALAVLFRGDIQLKQTSDSKLSSWEYAPSLKRSGEISVFAAYSSPIFLASIKSDEKAVGEEKLDLFTGIFKINRVYDSKIDCQVLCCNPNRDSFFWKTNVNDVNFYDSDSTKLNLLNYDTKKYYVGLFGEKIFRKNSFYQREICLISSENIEFPEDILAHLLSEKLYYNYLINIGLFRAKAITNSKILKVCSLIQLNSTAQKFAKAIYRDLNFEIRFDINNMIKLYLSPFFEVVGEDIYYKPGVLQKLKSVEFIKFIKYMQALDIKDVNMAFAISKEINFNKFLDNFEFVKIYTYYSKRTLIEILLKNKGEWYFD